MIGQYWESGPPIGWCWKIQHVKNDFEQKCTFMKTSLIPFSFTDREYENIYIKLIKRYFKDINLDLL